jgi:hypothetical protein
MKTTLQTAVDDRDVKAIRLVLAGQSVFECDVATGLPLCNEDGETLLNGLLTRYQEDPHKSLSALRALLDSHVPEGKTGIAKLLCAVRAEFYGMNPFHVAASYQCTEALGVMVGRLRYLPLEGVHPLDMQDVLGRTSVYLAVLEFRNHMTPSTYDRLPELLGSLELLIGERDGALDIADTALPPKTARQTANEIAVQMNNLLAIPLQLGGDGIDNLRAVSIRYHQEQEFMAGVPNGALSGAHTPPQWQPQLGW